MPLSAALANTALADANGLLTPQWGIYFRETDNAIAAVPTQAGLQPVRLTGQSASIGTTPIPADPLVAGLYRVTYSARITTVGSVSSSLVVTIAWTDGGVACAISSAALTTNTTSSVSSGSFLVNVDGGTPISYSTTYAANAAASMVYSLSLTLELVAAQ